jgi:hypothetical protein
MTANEHAGFHHRPSRAPTRHRVRDHHRDHHARHLLLYWVFKTQDEVKEHSGIGVGGVLGLVIYIVVSPITWFLIPSDVGKMYKADGRTAPFTGWTGLWLLLPLIGMFVWFIKIQGALNRYWESKPGAVAAPAVPAAV